MTSETKCFVCGAPFHPSSGGLFGHQNTPFCGACCRELLGFVKGHTARRWNKVRFYDHAYPPPAVVEG